MTLNATQKKAPYLLSIADEHAEPRTDFAVGTQQQAADVRDKRADCLIWCVRSVVQGQGHAQAGQVALLYLGKQRLDT